MSTSHAEVGFADRLARVKLSSAIEPGDLRVTVLVDELGAVKVLDYFEAVGRGRVCRVLGDPRRHRLANLRYEGLPHEQIRIPCQPQFGTGRAPQRGDTGTDALEQPRHLHQARSQGTAAGASRPGP